MIDSAKVSEGKKINEKYIISSITAVTTKYIKQICKIFDVFMHHFDGQIERTN